jgi:hypothetical protein
MGLERWSIRTATLLVKTKKFHHIMSFWNALPWRARMREDARGWCSASLHIGRKPPRHGASRRSAGAAPAAACKAGMARSGLHARAM